MLLDFLELHDNELGPWSLFFLLLWKRDVNTGQSLEILIDELIDLTNVCIVFVIQSLEALLQTLGHFQLREFFFIDEIQRGGIDGLEVLEPLRQKFIQELKVYFVLVRVIRLFDDLLHLL